MPAWSTTFGSLSAVQRLKAFPRHSGGDGAVPVPSWHRVLGPAPAEPPSPGMTPREGPALLSEERNKIFNAP